MAASCGGGGDEKPGTTAKPPARPHLKTACDRVPTAVAARVARVRPAVLTRSAKGDADAVSACEWRGGPVVLVRVSVDSAPQARRRFTNQQVEQQQFYAGDPELKPRLVKGVGEDAFHVPGAWWTRGYRTLSAYAHDRLLRIGVTVRGFSDADRLRAAKALGRYVARGLGDS